MDRVRVVRSNNDGIHTRGSSQVGEPMRGSRISRDLRNILAVTNIALRAGGVAHMLLHENALPVVAVGVAQAVVALLHFAHLVEARVGDVLRRCREHTCFGSGVIHGVGLGRGVIHRVGEHCLASGGLRGHAAIAVVGRHTGLRRAETHTRQAVLAIVTESLRQVFHVVLSSG